MQRFFEHPAFWVLLASAVFLFLSTKYSDSEILYSSTRNFPERFEYNRQISDSNEGSGFYTSSENPQFKEGSRSEVVWWGDTPAQWFMVGFTGVLVFLVWRTLVETRKLARAAESTLEAANYSVVEARRANQGALEMVEISHKRMEQEIRPFISWVFKDVNISTSDTSKIHDKKIELHIRFIGSVKNYGNAPAQKIEIFANVTEVSVPVLSMDTPSDNVKNQLGPLAPGEEHGFQIYQKLEVDIDSSISLKSTISIVAIFKYIYLDREYVSSKQFYMDNLSAFFKEIRRTGKSLNLHLVGTPYNSQMT